MIRGDETFIGNSCYDLPDAGLFQALEGELARVVGSPRGVGGDVERALRHHRDVEARLAHQLGHQLAAHVLKEACVAWDYRASWVRFRYGMER